MLEKIKVDGLYIQEYLYNKIERANKLYIILFHNKFPLDRPSDAEEYLKLHNEYESIVDMFRELQLYNWLNIDLYDRNDIVIK